MAQKGWHLFTALLLLHGVKGSLIKLRNGGYEDVVIGIHPSIPESGRIISSIKEMFEEASSYLYGASQRRFYFRTIKIVIPSTWASKPEYKRTTRESYEHADIIVAEPFQKYGDEPYTLQYGGCGQKGRYIHFTPDFLTDNYFLSVYGSRGKILVHEWAHLRWGVFDEYNYDAPFYSIGRRKIEATRCSASITGLYRFITRGDRTRRCRIERQTELYEPGCLFFPHKKQISLASIMFMQSLSSISQFCDKSNHNLMAPNMQNKMCSYKSTWEVITSSADFASSRPLGAPPPDPVIHLMKMQERALCLVLDASAAMGRDSRLGRMNQAAKLFLLQIIEKGSWVGIVTFNTKANIKARLQQVVNDNVRESLTSSLPNTATGDSNICEGVTSGFQIFTGKYPNSEGCEIVLLTNGEGTDISPCLSQIQNSGAIIHTIAFGSAASNDLEMLADMTGGMTFYATDSLSSNGLIDAFSKISSGSGDITQQSIQLESKAEDITSMRLLDGIFTIDKTVGSDTFFLITWSSSTSPPEISLKDPGGRKYENNDFIIENSNIRTARLKIPGTAKTGEWAYSIKNNDTAPQAISITVTTRAASATVPPVTVKSYMSNTNNTFPNPTIIYAEVTQGFLPIIGAIVMATVESTTGYLVELELLDDGAGADIIKNDGIYSRYFIAYSDNGRYSIKVSVQGQGKTPRRNRRPAMYISGYVDATGAVVLNPPRPVINDTTPTPGLGNFARVVSGADRYEIKVSSNPLDLVEINFPSATSLDTSDLIPEFSGVKQTFRYKPDDLTKENGTLLYFAIRAIDENNNIGEVSNIARATLLLRAAPPTPTSSRASVIIVCVAVLCVIAGITLYVLHKWKKSRRESVDSIDQTASSQNVN
ncbi:calcium-activated chloride channel regulator 1-like [Anolis sagrei]|uniref:calcium-activated chloride channel regulator 1-like n=1 Tax=Anolis sagrei TaxID=38937 RepID=UPI0035202B6D